MKLILVRHGKTEANEKHLYCGSADLPLSKSGRRQLAERKKSGCFPDIEGMRILTSGMKRCEETLRILYGNLPHASEAAFREMDFGAFEMRSYEEMKEDPQYIAWISGDNEANITPGGESGNQMKARVTAALEKLLAEDQDTALFTHGGVIAAVMEYLFPQEQKNRYEWQSLPGGGYVIDTEKMTYGAI